MGQGRNRDYLIKTASGSVLWRNQKFLRPIPEPGVARDGMKESPTGTTVSGFKYLGSILTEDGRLYIEIETKVQKANTVSYLLAPLLKHPNIPIETKAKLINSIFIPTLIYQCQTWTLTKSLARKITTCEMRCLRRAVNKTRREMIRKTTIREMVGTAPVLHYIQKQTLRWFGHLTRMAPHQLVSKAHNKKISGYKARGRPRKTWIEGVKETLKTHNIPPIQAVNLARDRKIFLPSTPKTVQEDG
ncbi:uncharacterized protein LOC143026952 [Oratosquilla oratoria]|uniref:uncharacterized protein LOC143026952 n=1 Tax=Oratosquilla oratoria TaxID=337810 RepID=UPI003F7591C5